MNIVKVEGVFYDDWEKRNPGIPEAFKRNYPDEVLVTKVGGELVRIKRDKKLHEIDESVLPAVSYAKALAACDVSLGSVKTSIERWYMPY